MTESSLVELRRLSHRYTRASGRLGLGRHEIQTLSEIDLAIGRGRFTAVVGPSGAGKSTLLRILAGLLAPTEGEVRWFTEAGLHPARRAQLLFQDARASFDPKLTLSESLEAPLVVHGNSDPRSVIRARLAEVGLDESVLRRSTAELSGGEAQRLALARALSIEPALLLADEPTASLDTVSRSEILDLLRGLRAARGLGLLIVTHDLAVATAVADEIVVLDHGRLVERLPASRFRDEASAAVSRRLLDATATRGGAA